MNRAVYCSSDRIEIENIEINPIDLAAKSNDATPVTFRHPSCDDQWANRSANGAEPAPLAPKFNLVSKPNDWSQTVLEAARGIESNEVTPTRQLQLEFWTQLRDFAQQRKTSLRFQKPLPQHWTTLAIGRSGYFMVATVNTQDGAVSAQLVLNSLQAKAAFKELAAQRLEIERTAGVQFEWRELPEKRQSRIELRRSADPASRQTWPELFSWLVDHLELIHRTFGARVKALQLV